MTEMHHYRDCGLPNVWLKDGVEVHDTPYGRATSIQSIDKLHRAIGMHIAQSKRQMTGPEVRFLRTELDLSQATLAGLLDVQENTLRRWELGETKIPGPAQRALGGYYVETVSEDGNLKDLMDKLAKTDRELAEVKLRFTHVDDDWEPEAA